MKKEIQSAVDFLTNMLKGRLKDETMENFKLHLQDSLRKHYQNHWFEREPFRGSGYRCIRLNPTQVDPILSKTCAACKLDVKTLIQLLPKEITLWVDPEDVSYRIGENGSIGVLYTGHEQSQQDINIQQELQLQQEQQQRQQQMIQKQLQQQQQQLHLQLQQQYQHSWISGSCKREINRLTIENQRHQMPVFS